MSKKKSFALLYESTTLSSDLKDIVHKIEKEDFLTNEDALLLFNQAELGYLGILANAVKERLHGDKVFFNRNFHIEPTNLCVFTCNFCAYSRLLKQEDEGWVLTKEQMLDKVRSYAGQPITEVHVVGGVHPKLTLDFFIDLFKDIKALRPDIHIKAFTAVEYDYMFKKAKVSVKEGLSRLKQAGLESIPGGGAEIFDEGIRAQICKDKCTSTEWLNIHETAHKMGMHSNATMLYGHIEKYEHRINHMERLRELQNRTRMFNVFIPLKFRNGGENAMAHVSEVSVLEDLRNYAISRLYLHNVPHLKAYWPMCGRSTTQLALSYGVDDIDGTIDDSTKIYSMAGAEDKNPKLSTQQLVKLIKDAGRKPIERDTLFNVVQDYTDFVFPQESSAEHIPSLPLIS